MTAEQLRAHITAAPFRTFYLRAADGRRIPIYNRDFILITPTERHVFVFQPNDAYEVFDIELLPGVEFGPPQAPPPAPKPSDTSA